MVHNAAQLLVALVITKTTGLLYYLPVLLLLGAAFGFVIGLVLRPALVALRRALLQQ